jgi:hypothetical protein
MKKVERWKMEMPTEEEMLPKDKYSVFDRKVKRYRKGIHSTLGPEGVVGSIAGMLIINRGPEVDEGQPETQSSWFLDGQWDIECILSVIIPLHRIRRMDGRTMHTSSKQPRLFTIQHVQTY